MGRLSLIHALSLVVLYASAGSPKFEPAAVRWLARLALEGREMRLNEIQLPPPHSRACEAAARAGREDATPTPLTVGCSRPRSGGVIGELLARSLLAAWPASDAERRERPWSSNAVEPSPTRVERLPASTGRRHASMAAAGTEAAAAGSMLLRPAGFPQCFSRPSSRLRSPLASQRRGVVTNRTASRWSAWQPPLSPPLRWRSAHAPRSGAGRRTSEVLDRTLAEAERARDELRGRERASCSEGTHELQALELAVEEGFDWIDERTQGRLRELVEEAGDELAALVDESARCPTEVAVMRPERQA